MHISRADSDASERAPLISSPSGRGGSTSSAAGDALKASNSNAMTTATSNGKGQQQQQQQFANKNPRMGYAIGYLRKASGQVKTYLSLHKLAYLKSKYSSYQTESGLPNASNTGNARSHEYQDIADEADSAPAAAAPPAAAEGVDDLVGGPLDLGPSLMDEVSEGCAFFSHVTVSIGVKAVLLGVYFIVLLLHKSITPPK